jgi:uncharacterized DUF497 family protein
MDFEYDPSKDEANRFKHGLELSFGLKIFDDPAHIILASHREIDGEERYKAIGLVGDKLYTAVHVWRGGTIRLISVRRSNAGEQGNYDRHSG